MQPQENKWLALREPLPPPAIDGELETLPVIQRSTECLRHFILSTEHWISPHGRLRWWLKINLCLWAWLFIPAVVLMPVISLVLHEVDGWLSALLSIAWKLVVLGILSTVAIVAIKRFPSSSKGSSRRRK